MIKLDQKDELKTTIHYSHRSTDGLWWGVFITCLVTAFLKNILFTARAPTPYPGKIIFFVIQSVWSGVQAGVTTYNEGTLVYR